MSNQVQPTDRVTVSFEAWRLIDALLADLPYRVSAPIVQKLLDTGGVQPVEKPAQEAPDDKPG